MRILIGSDFCPIGRNEKLLASPSTQLDGVKDLFSQYDYVLANLECPLTECASPINKVGPHLSASPDVVKGIKYLGIDALALANNHIMDHGEQGLASTLSALNDAGIPHFGADASLQKASKPLRIDRDGSRMSFFTFAENEFSLASPDRPGANSLEISHVVRQILSEPKDRAIVVLIHGGNEYRPYPNPYLRDTCRLMVELGAQAVLCQHSHCIGAMEQYRNGFIVYGQGNFVFDYPSTFAGWNQGVFVDLSICGSELIAFQLVPFFQKAGTQLLEPAKGDEAQTILDMISEYSAFIADEQQYVNEWREYCEKQRIKVTSILGQHGKLLRFLNRRMNLTKWLNSSTSRQNLAAWLTCESHYAILKTLSVSEKHAESKR